MPTTQRSTFATTAFLLGIERESSDSLIRGSCFAPGVAKTRVVAQRGRDPLFGPAATRSSMRFTFVGFPRVITGYELVVVNIIRPALLIVARRA
jgi:hypothetical protein